MTIALRGVAHPAWCGQTRCTLGEHRSDPLLVDVDGAGRAVVTRVLGVDGRQWAEVRVRLALSEVEPRARWQVLRLLHLLRVTLAEARKVGRRLWLD